MAGKVRMLKEQKRLSIKRFVRTLEVVNRKQTFGQIAAFSLRKH